MNEIAFDFVSLLFYGFSALLLGSAMAVICARNSVYSVFFLILAFFNAAALFVLLGAEYLAMTLVIVYVGAVAVLFLFVVMMLNINYEKLREGFAHHLPLGIGVAVILFAELAALLYAASNQLLVRANPASPIPDAGDVTNTQAIGAVLYTDYIYLFQMSGLVLLVAMIGAIVLTLRHRPGVRRQKIAAQVSRTREQSIEMIDIKKGQGI